MDTQVIQTKENRIRELRRATHTAWNDPGHGWLEVRRADLHLLGIADKISRYSYSHPDGKTVYLEEDMDATTYLEALFGKEFWRFPSYEFQQFQYGLKSEYREHIFIRSLPHYSF